jgi:uncharacterized protein YgiM (DUF1202 family)
MVVRSLVASLVASAGLLAWAPAASAELVMVRVVGDNVTVKSRPSRMADTLAKPQADTVLEVLDKEGSWFWVLITRDNHGTQRVGWVKESDVEFVDSAVARFFLPSEPIPIGDEPAATELAADAAPVEATAAAEPAVAETAAAAAMLKAEETPVTEAKPVKVAKAEKPKKVDDRKLRKAAQDYEKALQAYEKLQFAALATDQPLLPVGEPIIEPLYSLQN